MRNHLNLDRYDEHKASNYRINRNTNYIGYPIDSNLTNRKSNSIIFRFIETNDPKVHEEQTVPNNNRLHKRDT